MEAPTGNVTFLFTDIEGSTKLAHNLPDRYNEILQKHDQVLKDHIESCNGFIFKKVGDSFCSSFSSAGDALKAAVEIQKKLINDGDELKNKVRIGIHSGKAEYHEKDYNGYVTLSKAKRIMSAASGGQILLSSSSYELICDSGSNTCTFRDLGNRLLKDIAQPVHFYQALSAGLHEDFPPLMTLDARPNNLPAALASFIGRESVIRELKECIKHTHLLTISGSGGVGKTRLSIELANDLIDENTNGVWLAELAPLRDPSFIIPSLLKIFDVKENAGRTVEDTLIEFLKEKEMLIIFDNCEHLITDCASIIDKILRNCPRLKIIATSREALHIQGEVIYHLDTLSTPDINNIPSFEKLEDYESIRLFVNRATDVNSGFRITDTNANAVVQLCYHLDGIPLAIELAAARTRILSPEDILERLKDRFDLLRSGVRSAMPRQQTLRALIDWSYDLLSEKEKLIFQRLSVFSGGWTLEAAESICSDAEIDSYEILDLLSNLIDKSIVKVKDCGDSLRYSMLETIKKYGEEKLSDSVRIHERHFDYFLTVSASPEPPDDDKQIDVHKLIEADMDNIRSALRWSIESNSSSALQLAIQFGYYCNWKGYYNEAFETYCKILDNNKDIPPGLRSASLMHAGSLASMMGNFDTAEKFMKEGLEYFKITKDEKSISECLDGLGMNDFYRGEPERAIKYYEESLSISRRLGHKQNIADTLCNFGTLLLYLGENDRASESLHEGLNLCRELNSIFTAARILQNLGGLYYQKGDYATALENYEEALGLINEIGDKNATSIVLLNLGNLYFTEKNYSKAEQMYQQGFALANAFNFTMAINHFSIKMGDLALIQGQNAKAKEIYLTCIQKFYNNSDLRRLASSFFGIAKYYLAEKQYELAAENFGISEQIFEQVKFKQSKSRLDEFNGHIKEISNAIGIEKFKTIFEKGKNKSLEDTVKVNSNPDN